MYFFQKIALMLLTFFFQNGLKAHKMFINMEKNTSVKCSTKLEQNFFSSSIRFWIRYWFRNVYQLHPWIPKASRTWWPSTNNATPLPLPPLSNPLIFGIHLMTVTGIFWNVCMFFSIFFSKKKKRWMTFFSIIWKVNKIYASIKSIFWPE